MILKYFIVRFDPVAFKFERIEMESCADGASKT